MRAIYKPLEVTLFCYNVTFSFLDLTTSQWQRRMNHKQANN